MKRILSTIAITVSAVLVTGSYVQAGEKETPEGRAGWFEKADTDNSGTITIEEFTVVMKEKGKEEGEISEAFAKKDANSDGVLSKEECMKGHKKHKEHESVSEKAAEENH